jgi:hypothetical protein
MTNSPQDANYFRDWTHPSALDVKDSSVHAFVQDLKGACLSVFPRKPPQYTEVHALLLHWADDDLGKDELVEFHAQLKEQFNFTAEIWKTPSQCPDCALEKKIVDVKAAHEGENKLLIVYYGGHGKYDQDSRSIWTAPFCLLFVQSSANV